MAFADLAWIYISWILLVFVAASIAQMGGVSISLFYPYLNRPAWTLPAFAITIIWFILYVLFGIWVARIYLIGTWPTYPIQLTVFVVHMVAIGLWYVPFARYQAFGVAFAWQFVILAIGILNYILFLLISTSIEIILLPIPYFVWMLYALIQGYFIWSCNCGWTRIFCAAARCRDGRPVLLESPSAGMPTKNTGYYGGAASYTPVAQTGGDMFAQQQQMAQQIAAQMYGK